MRSGWKIVLQAIAFFAIVGGTVWLAGHREPEEQKPIGPKRLSSTVVEGLVYRSPKERYPRATCDACRIGKKKLGLISIGALNTIEFDNLVVNLKDRKRTPVKGSDARGSRESLQDGGQPVERAKSFVDALDLKPLIGLSNDRARQFAGIKIRGFELNVVNGNELCPIVKARSVRDEGRSVKLYEVTVYSNGVAENHATAGLELEPRLQIVWDGGFLDLEQFVD